MSQSAYREALVTGQFDSTPYTASTTPTSILPSNAVFSPPAGKFQSIGNVMRMTAHGRMSNIVTTPGTLTLSVMFGAIIVATSVINLNAVAKANVPWSLEWDLTLRSVGGGTLATCMHQGRFTSESVVGSPLPTVGGAGIAMLPNATPAVGTGFNSTIAFAVDLFATWSLNNANSITCHQAYLESVF
jgi:hypothetical protein